VGLTVEDSVALGGLVVAALGVVAGLVGTFLTWKGLPKKRIYFGLSDVADLLLSEKLNLQYERTQLSAPHTVTVVIESDGRNSVQRDDFDNGEPLVLQLGADILEVIRASSSPAHYRVPLAVIEGQSLHIGPSRIGRQQTIFYTLIIDGRPELSCSAPLADVTVEPLHTRRIRRARQTASKWLRRHQVLVFAAILTAVFSGAFTYFTSRLDYSGDQIEAFVRQSQSGGRQLGSSGAD